MYSSSGTVNYGRLIAVLRSETGRRRTAQINESDCTSWPACKEAIIADLNRDGTKRFRTDLDDIDEPLDSGDAMPWQRETPKPLVGQDNQNVSQGAITASLYGPVRRDAGRKYMHRPRMGPRGLDIGFGRKTNEDYLRELEEAQFAADPAKGEHEKAKRLDAAAIDAEIDANNRAIAELTLQLLERGANVATFGQRATLLAQSNVGRAILEGR
jgi:hypothetical protein